MTFKRKVSKITIEYADGGENHTYHNLEATFSISKNARKAGGYRNAQEWDEFHITWIRYHEEAKPIIFNDPEPVKEIPTGVRADDYLDNPLFMGIEHGVPKFRKPQDLIDFGLDGVWNDTGSY